MAVFPLDKRQHPDFAIPGRKPIGPVEIDRDNKFGKHLEAGYLLRENTVARDVTGRYDGTKTTDNFFPLRGSSVGIYQDWAANGNTANRFNIDSEKLRGLFDGSHAFTLIFHAIAELTAASTSVIFSLDGSDDFIIYLSGSANRTYRVFWRNVTSVPSFNQTGTEYQGTWNKYAYTFDGVDSHKIFINGNEVSSATASGSGAGPYTSGPAICGWAGSAQYFKESVSSVLIFNKDFSSSISELSDDIYQTLKPVVGLQWFSDAAPPTGFKPYFAANANTIMQGF